MYRSMNEILHSYICLNLKNNLSTDPSQEDVHILVKTKQMILIQLNVLSK